MRAEEILNIIPQESIFELVFKEGIKLNKAIYKNPTRVDGKGSCFFKKNGTNGKLHFVDLSRNVTYDCFDMIQSYYNLRNFNETKDYILSSFGKTDVFISEGYTDVNRILLEDLKVKGGSDKVEDKTFFKLKLRNYNKFDAIIFKRAHISINTIKYFGLKAVEEYSTSNKNYPLTLSYKYKENENDVVIRYKTKRGNYKLYRPNAEYKHDKWKTNMDIDEMLGLDELKNNIKNNDEPRPIIITGGFRDMLVLHEAGFLSIAPNGEGYMYNESVIYYLKSLKEKGYSVYIMYDRDEVGDINSVKRSIETGFPRLILPQIINNNEGSCKDITEVCENYGVDYVTKIINKLLN